MTPEQEAASGKQWGSWIGDVANQGKFVSTSQLGFTGIKFIIKTRGA